MAIHLHIVYVYFGVTMAELNICDKECLAHKVQDIYYLALYRKFIDL